MVLAEDNDTDVVVLQVERHALDAAVEAHQLAGLHAAEAVDARDTVSHRQHAAQVDHRRLVGLLPLLDGRDQLVGDVLDQVLGGELGAAHLIQGLGLGGFRGGGGARRRSARLPWVGSPTSEHANMQLQRTRCCHTDGNRIQMNRSRSSKPTHLAGEARHLLPSPRPAPGLGRRSRGNCEDEWD